MDISFENKRALVTGAGKGIGRDLAKKLVKCGAETYALSRTKSDLDSLKEECSSIHTIICDLADWNATEKAVKSCGSIDLLVNNAAVAILQPFLEITPEAFDKTVTVNLKSIIQVSQIVAKDMIARGTGGSIVNVSSKGSKAAIACSGAYGSIKAAVDQLTAVMGLELGPHKIRVNAVNPIVVKTKMGSLCTDHPVWGPLMLAKIPLGRFAEVEEVVDVILFLLSDKASMINAVCLPIDEGYLAA